MNTATTATQTEATTSDRERGCYCPGDCHCGAPAWMQRVVYCGCRAHS